MGQVPPSPWSNATGVVPGEVGYGHTVPHTQAWGRPRLNPASAAGTGVRGFARRADDGLAWAGVGRDDPGSGRRWPRGALASPASPLLRAATLRGSPSTRDGRGALPAQGRQGLLPRRRRSPTHQHAPGPRAPPAHAPPAPAPLSRPAPRRDHPPTWQLQRPGQHRGHGGQPQRACAETQRAAGKRSSGPGRARGGRSRALQLAEGGGGQ